MRYRSWRFWGVVVGSLALLYAVGAPTDFIALVAAWHGVMLLLEWHAAHTRAKDQREFDRFVADVSARVAARKKRGEQ